MVYTQETFQSDIGLNTVTKEVLQEQAKREGKLLEELTEEIITKYLTGELVDKNDKLTSSQEMLERIVQQKLNAIGLLVGY